MLDLNQQALLRLQPLSSDAAYPHYCIGSDAASDCSMLRARAVSSTGEVVSAVAHSDEEGELVVKHGFFTVRPRQRRPRFMSDLGTHAGAGLPEQALDAASAAQALDVGAHGLAAASDPSSGVEHFSPVPPPRCRRPRTASETALQVAVLEAHVIYGGAACATCGRGRLGHSSAVA